jgi:hypothetical protein
MKVLSAFPLSGFSLVKSLFKKPSAPPIQQPVTRDDARDQAARQDELLRRRGGAADIVTGSYGAEAPPGAKTTLGS